jgi:hypothetical protein
MSQIKPLLNTWCVIVFILNGVATVQSTGGSVVKIFTGFVSSIYFLGALFFGSIHHRGHPEDSFFDAVAAGLAWPDLLVEIVRSPIF